MARAQVVVWDMISSLYERCHQLFAGYPLAVTTVNRSGTVRSMTLMRQDSQDARFFVLSQDCSEGSPVYSLCPWNGCDRVDIDEDGADDSTKVDAKVMISGVPIPRHGSLFGWRSGDSVTALVPIHADYTPTCPEPAWKVMPRAGIPAEWWPPFTNESLLGHWFWSYYRAGRIVSLATLIAGKPDTVFWTDRQEVPGRDCCAVARDITSPEGYTLRRGRYVYYGALRTDKPVPPMSTLLADVGRIDIAPRFRRYECHDRLAAGC